MQKLIDGFFQQIINYCLKNNLNLIYKLLFVIFKKIIKGPFVINFTDYKFLERVRKSGNFFFYFMKK
jgi:hypothetical protein